MFYDMFCAILCCFVLKKLISSATIIEIARSVVKDQGQTLILFNLVSKSSPVFDHFIFRCNKVLEYECGYSFLFWRVSNLFPSGSWCSCRLLPSKRRGKFSDILILLRIARPCWHAPLSSRDNKPDGRSNYLTVFLRQIKQMM